MTADHDSKGEANGRSYVLITDEHVAEFQRLFKEHFGIELTKAQALDKGHRLIRLIEVVSRVLVGEHKGDGNI